MGLNQTSHAATSQLLNPVRVRTKDRLALAHAGRAPALLLEAADLLAEHADELAMLESPRERKAGRARD
jgi:hypothetical protein